MRSFADILTTVAAEADATKRVLTTRDKVKTALKLDDPDDDTLIDDLIKRVTGLIEAGTGCRLAGPAPTFALETLEARWLIEPNWRSADIYLPWRVPVTEIVSVVENGVTLSAGTDYLLVGQKPGRLRRTTADRVICWSGLAIVVRFKAGFALPAGVDPKLETACIEQVKAMLFAADRDPALRQTSANDIGFDAYSLPGGDTFKGVLLPQVLDAISSFVNPLP